jgi:hypothetical protein
MSSKFSKFPLASGVPPATAIEAAVGFSIASCFCSSIAAFCMASAPKRPWPRNVSGDLWYTEARLDSSAMRVSRRAGGSDWIMVFMGGFSDRTTFYAVLENRRVDKVDASYLCNLRIG